MIEMRSKIIGQYLEADLFHMMLKLYPWELSLWISN